MERETCLKKTILVANTYNKIPISKRKDLEDFTPQVLNFLSRHPILLLTGWALYCMVEDILEGIRSRQTGRLIYADYKGKKGKG